MSSPALMKFTACTAPQSEVTYPLNPIWSRRIVVSVSLFPHANVPFSLLYEHMIDDTPAFTAASNGATYTSCSVWSSIYVFSFAESYPT